MSIKEGLHFERFAQEVLNKYYQISLLSDVKIGVGKASYSFDLADLKNNVYVEIKHTLRSSNRGSTLQSLQGRFGAVAKTDQTQRFFLLFSVKINKSDIDFFIKSFNTWPDSEIDVWDIDKINQIAAEVGIEPFISDKLQDKHDKKSNPYSKRGENPGQDRLDDYTIPQFIGTRKFYVGGHYFGRNDQLKRFYNDGLWESGDDRYSSQINAVKVGDIIVLKSTFRTNNGNSYLRIKGFGVVNSNLGNGTKLLVNWHLFNEDEYVDVDGLGFHSSTFGKITSDNMEIILQNVIEKHLDILKTLWDLIAFASINVKTRNYWWFRNHDQRLKFSDLQKGKLFEYPVDDEVKKRVETYFFYEADIGDFCIGFDGLGDESEIVILEVASKWATENDNFSFKVIEKVSTSLMWSELQSIPELGDSLLVKDDSRYSDFLKLSVSEYSAILVILNIDDLNRYLHEPILVGGGGGINNGNEPPNQDYNDAENSDSANSPEAKDKIKFQLDNVESNDKLGREPVAESIARLINDDIFSGNEEIDQAFMIHLQGAWGSGKSTFLNLIRQHLNTNSRKWVVIDYNAWENQHVDPPWWAFINTIHRDTLRKLTLVHRIFLWPREQIRRFFRYKGWKNLTLLLMTVMFTLLLYFYGKQVLNSASEIFINKSTTGIGNGTGLELLIKIVIGVGSLGTLLYGLSRFISAPLFIHNSDQAKSFLQKSADPYSSIKKHYNSLIKSINFCDYSVAIFIDDLDRCDKENVVRLLEGIQTLFKSKKVLFIVAADKKWISNCFDKHYSEFAETVSNSPHKLGELFVEKAFQLSVRMPQISNSTKQKYWNSILEVKSEQSKDISLNKKDKKVRHDLIQKINNKYSVADIRKPSTLAKIEKDESISSEVVTSAALEILDSNQKLEVQHLLSKFYKVIEGNPRSIKRMANEYSVLRNTLVAERKLIDNDILFRWVVLKNQYSTIASTIENDLGLLNDTQGIEEFISKTRDSAILHDLIVDKDSRFGGVFKKESLQPILGSEL